MRFYDAHNHLQDERLRPWRDQIPGRLAEKGIVRVVVNGTCEDDWPAVLALARKHPMVLASFGYHPWFVRARRTGWQRRLVEFLDQVPSAVGEIGLDRWILDQQRRGAGPTGATRSCPSPASLEEQAEVFTCQLRLAAERNLPVSIHCLRAWGRLHQLLRREPRPACGFLLHSYGGPVEMVKPFADLGAFFSLPGAFGHERKTRQRNAFKEVPAERLLIETDAPDQCPPPGMNRYPLTDEESALPLNHPANLTAVYEFAAELRGESLETLTDRVEQNWLRLFATV